MTDNQTTTAQRRTALITGGSRGIGLAVAQKLAQDGNNIVVTYRSNKELADQAMAEISENFNVEAHAYQADARDHDAINNAITEVAELNIAAPTILINNAGITRDTLFMRMSDDDWNNVLQTHLNGAFYATKAVIRGMMKQRFGRIINITSVQAYVGPVGQANYATAKAGLIGFTRAIAKEHASRGITCNAVAPGPIESDMTKEAAPEWREQALKQVPAGRFGQVEEVANLISFLSSEKAGYITGVTVPIDGGFGMGV
jgi:3-oxoacyl-[acyl-carrier protein] reductase